MHLLLIEDEKALSDAIRKLLEQARYTVDTAYDGEEGLLLALGGSYDAIILDVMLPKMDGFTVLRRLRGKQNATPVLMLTARGGLQDRVQGLEGGADYYLPKPFEKAELLACLHAITRRKGGRARKRSALCGFDPAPGGCFAPMRGNRAERPPRRKGVSADGTADAPSGADSAEGDDCRTRLGAGRRIGIQQRGGVYNVSAAKIDISGHTGGIEGDARAGIQPESAGKGVSRWFGS